MLNKRITGYILQDLGMALFLGCVFASALIVGNSSSSLRIENIIMMMGLFIAVILASFKAFTLAVVVSSIQVIIFTAYKVFYTYNTGLQIEFTSYLWLFLPFITIGSIMVYLQGNIKTESENEMLREQVEELTMIEPLTGLYNLRSLYNDLGRQMAYSARNNLDISLMIIELRYESELKTILSKKNYEILRQKMALIVQDALRIEDRIYAIDEKGTLAIILTCDTEGSVIVKNRIKNKLNDKEAFSGITDSPIKVDTKIAFLQYDEKEVGTNAIAFKQRVESELQYEV